MNWFGETWDRRGCDDDLHDRVPVPVGEMCLWCNEAIEAQHRGFVMPYSAEGWTSMRPEHLECFIRSIIGSVAHQMRQCTCFGGDAGDDEAHTKREAAIAAYTFYVSSVAGVYSPRPVQPWR